MEVDLDALYKEVCAQLREAELRAAELRGQVQLLERLAAAARQPIISGDPLNEAQEP